MNPVGAPSIPDPSTVVLMVRAGGMVELNSHPLPVDELQQKLVAIFGGRKEAVVFVDGERNLEFQEVARVIDLARAAGIERVGLMPGPGARLTSRW